MIAAEPTRWEEPQHAWVRYASVVVVELGKGALVVGARFGIPGVFQVDFSSDDWQSIKERFSKEALLHGPCLVIERQGGLAFDATTNTEPGQGCRPLLWPVHGAPWQQWRFQRDGRGIVSIRNEHTGLALTTDPPSKLGDGSWMWMDRFRGTPNQLWRLKETDDRAAFVIKSEAGHFALDAGAGEHVEIKQHPIAWEHHGDACQQWIVARLPLT